MGVGCYAELRRAVAVAVFVTTTTLALLMPTSCEQVIPRGEPLTVDALEPQCENGLGSQTPARTPTVALALSLIPGVRAAGGIRSLELKGRPR